MSGGNFHLNISSHLTHSSPSQLRPVSLLLFSILLGYCCSSFQDRSWGLSLSFAASHNHSLCLSQFGHSLVSNLGNPMYCSMPGFLVHHQLLELAQTHVHWAADAIQTSHLLLTPSPPTFNLSQHLGLFQWVNSSHQVAKVLELQLQHQSFQWIFRTDLL